MVTLICFSIRESDQNCCCGISAEEQLPRPHGIPRTVARCHAAFASAHSNYFRLLDTPSSLVAVGCCFCLQQHLQRGGMTCCEGAYPPGVLGVCVCLSLGTGAVRAVRAPLLQSMCSVWDFCRLSYCRNVATRFTTLVFLARVLVRVPQRNRTGRVSVGVEKEMYCEGLAHVIVEAGKSHDLRVQVGAQESCQNSVHVGSARDQEHQCLRAGEARCPSFSRKSKFTAPLLFCSLGPLYGLGDVLLHW